ncbi:MAG: polysaccharide biosynthesis/export family protein [Desulfobacteraceae bacterium]|nr:polysaccharide biosynthesis/export family protein [Desulfobacteraceae bacterium]
MVGKHKLLVPVLALALGGCSLAPGLHIPDKKLQYETKGGTGWRIQNGSLVYATEPKFKVTEIDGKVITSQEQEERLAVKPEVNLEKSPEELSRYEYRVGPQDVLAFTVWDHPELTSPTAAANAAFTSAVSPLGSAAPQPVPTDNFGHHVSADGTIFFPYVGEVKVEGLTLEEIRRKIAAGLASYIPKPQIDVRVSAYRSKKVFVTGEVKNPTTVYITNTPITVTDAITAAQGYSPEADLRKVRLTRGDQSFVLNLVALYDDGDISQNWVLQNGDILNVSDRKDSKVFIMGEVKKPDVLFMRKGRMSLSESIGLAGGLDQASVNAKRVFVIRGLNQNPDFPPSIYHLDLSRPDALLLSTRFELKPLDIVYVSTAEVARLGRVLAQIIPTVQTLTSGLYWITQ